MTNILLNSRGFVIEVIFFLILPFSYQGKNFCTWKKTKFWPGEENFPRQKILLNEIFPDKVIVFQKSLVTPSKIRTVFSFYANALKLSLKSVFAYIVDLAFIGQITFSRNFENDWNKNVNLKIILIAENSFLEMCCNKIKSFWRNSVYSLVIDV